MVYSTPQHHRSLGRSSSDRGTMAFDGLTGSTRDGRPQCYGWLGKFGRYGGGLATADTTADSIPGNAPSSARSGTQNWTIPGNAPSSARSGTQNWKHLARGSGYDIAEIDGEGDEGGAVKTSKSHRNGHGGPDGVAADDDDDEADMPSGHARASMQGSNDISGLSMSGWEHLRLTNDEGQDGVDDISEATTEGASAERRVARGMDLYSTSLRGAQGREKRPQQTGEQDEGEVSFQQSQDAFDPAAHFTPQRPLNPTASILAHSRILMVRLSGRSEVRATSIRLRRLCPLCLRLRSRILERPSDDGPRTGESSTSVGTDASFVDVRPVLGRRDCICFGARFGLRCPCGQVEARSFRARADPNDSSGPDQAAQQAAGYANSSFGVRVEDQLQELFARFKETTAAQSMTRRVTSGAVSWTSLRTVDSGRGRIVGFSCEWRGRTVQLGDETPDVEDAGRSRPSCSLLLLDDQVRATSSRSEGHVRVMCVQWVSDVESACECWADPSFKPDKSARYDRQVYMDEAVTDKKEIHFSQSLGAMNSAWMAHSRCDAWMRAQDLDLPQLSQDLDLPQLSQDLWEVLRPSLPRKLVARKVQTA
ncbi:hypothetical protein A4X09_0g5011 [Tilletia walkeri]|uniref:Uncharacterized protein n=1 Tax=Tilletia walkeri TaxID=117179 RepID=A0A8X7N832_9BASI|nr:hypothetical protein A4X09_0g5011 [Tilletia walkeri]